MQTVAHVLQALLGVERHDWRGRERLTLQQGELEVEVVDAELQQRLPVLGLLDDGLRVAAEGKCRRPHPAGCLGGLATQDRVGTVVVVGDPVAGLEHDLATDLLDGLLELGSPAPFHIAQCQVLERDGELRGGHRLEYEARHVTGDDRPPLDGIHGQHLVVQIDVDALGVVQVHGQFGIGRVVPLVLQVQFPPTVRKSHHEALLVVAEAAVRWVLLRHDVVDQVVGGQRPDRLDDDVCQRDRRTPMQVAKQPFCSHREHVRHRRRVHTEQMVVAVQNLDCCHGLRVLARAVRTTPNETLDLSPWIRPRG